MMLLARKRGSHLQDSNREGLEMKSLLFFVLVVHVLFVAADDVTCKKKGKFSKTITIGSGDSYSFNTQAKKKYGGNVKCSVTYKRGSSCPKIRFSCSKFNINNKKSKCSGKTGDRMMIQEQGSKKLKSYGKKKRPDISTTSKFLKVSFISNKKKHSTGAECRVECESDTTSPPSTGGSGSVTQKWLPWFLGMVPMELCVETGTEVIFNKTGHNVVQMATQADYDGCTGFLGENPTVGNNIDPFPWQAEMDGVYYFACGVGTHCSAGGMKAKITVAPSCAKNVTVPWSFGMEPQVLCVETGTTVIIDKTGSFHNVNMLATKSDYDNCTGFTDTAGNSDNPYIFQADMQGSYYFACGVGTHCKSGNMKAMITVTDSCQ